MKFCPAWILLIVLLPGPAAYSADPDWYVKKDTWQASMTASRDVLIALESSAAKADTFQPYLSEVVQGGQPARKVRVPVAGLKELYLIVTGVPGVTWGAADWADAKLIDADGKEMPACHLPSLKVLEGRHSIDCNLDSGVSGPLKIAGRQFDHGIHVYADSKIRIDLDGSGQWFEAHVGIDDWVGQHGAVRFRVADSKGAARYDLWKLLARDFSEETPRREMRWEREDLIWEQDRTPAELAWRYVEASHRVKPLVTNAVDNDLQRARELYYRSRTIDEAIARARSLDFEALRLAITDLSETFAEEYSQGPEFLSRWSSLQEKLTEGDLSDYEAVTRLVDDYDQLKREALLANPLLDFQRLLLVKRIPNGDPRRALGTGYLHGEYLGLPRQSSKCHPGIERPFDWDNEIAVLSPVGPKGKLKTLYRPDDRRLVTDVDLHFDAEKLLFSMPGSHDRWHVFEMGLDGRGLRQLTPGDQPDVHFYDSCYLPNGRIAMVSTAPLQGVPCNTGVIVGMMYVMDADGSNIRQVCFEQDHNYCPTVTHDGRVMYLRWDYTDTPHVWNRMLFTMNPDGTGQTELYGSNSYWPNAVFYARPVPNHPTKVIGIVTGHHVGRVGELVLFDPAQGRHEADGVVQRIPGRGQKVEPLIEDKLTEHSWPKFLHPYPLSEKYFLVSCKPTPDALWGIYLVDVFDNMVLIREEERHALLEPLPLRKTPRPPVVPPKAKPNRNDALVYMADIYAGPGLKDVPRGTVKRLRVFTYHFGYQKIAGIEHRVGADGPWEVKRVLGTVPVEPDGSAMFRIPAKTPLSLQPLDAQGKALQLMRSWMTAMPGETLSCVGCHENRNATPPARQTMAQRRRPSKIEPWYGPTRGFSFAREVQPVLDRYCVGCHGGKTDPDLRGNQGKYIVFDPADPQARVIEGVAKEELIRKYRAVFEPSYVALKRLVRGGGLESDLHLLPPLEFHADTNELVQMLQKGHYGVQLDRQAWDRLITWIDLNTPCHGTWSELTGITDNQRARRHALRRLYGGVDEDAEESLAVPIPPVEPVVPRPSPNVKIQAVKCDGWPFDTAEAARRQSADGSVARSVELGEGVTLELVKIPAGRFVMDHAAVAIEQPFWMGRFEVTNRQFARFDPRHDSRFEHRTSWIFSEDYLGWPLDGPKQPVVRISWDRAMAFCRWLSKRTGMTFSLPTEAQWEYACRAGTDTPFSFGDLDTDFSPFANMADRTIRELAYEAWRPKPPDLVPRDDRFDDGVLVTTGVGHYRPNTWALHDMHGNAAEWTRTDAPTDGRQIVRGGSWRDRPQRCSSAFRLRYQPWQRVYNVGFRVVCKDSGKEDGARLAGSPPAG